MTTIRHGGPCGLRIEMRAAERREIGHFFVLQRPRPNVTRSEGGGCYMLKSRNAAKPLSSMCLIPPWLAILKQPSPCVPGAHVEKDESDPPQNRGAM